MRIKALASGAKLCQKTKQKAGSTSYVARTRVNYAYALYIIS